MITNSEELITFLKQYHAPLLVGDPPRPLEAAAVEVPAPLKRLYDAFGHQVGRLRGPLSTQDSLLPPGKLKRDGDLVTFLSENQGCWACSYALDGKSNAVFKSEDGPEDELLTESLEDFLITFSLQEAVMSSPYLIATDSTLEPGDLGIQWRPLQLEARYAIEGIPQSYFLAENDPGLLCMDMKGISLWLASYSEKVLEFELPGLEFQVIYPHNYRRPLPPDATAFNKFKDWFSRL